MSNHRTQRSTNAATTANQLADYRWLVEGEGRNWLERPEVRDAPLVELVRRLRRELTAQQTHVLLQQLELRRRAARRWRGGASLYFTERALEQATDPHIAAYKASRFPAGQGVVDLCCGIGGDLCALAKRGPVLGVDLDPIVAYLAGANLRCQMASEDGWAAIGDADQLSVSSTAGIHLDPDRRPGGRRSVQLTLHQPGIERIAQLASHPAGMALKLAPATDASHSILASAELEWIGHNRQCQQLVAWFGPLARNPGCRAATVINPQGKAQRLVAVACERVCVTTEVRRYVIEPHPTVLAAGLTAAIAAPLEAGALTPGGGYLTADRPVSNSWVTSFEVLDVMPFHRSRLRAWLTERGIGRVEVKKRGVAIDPSPLQRQLSSPGSGFATVILLPIGHRLRAIVTRRVVADSPTATAPTGGEAMITGSDWDPQA